MEQPHPLANVQYEALAMRIAGGLLKKWAWVETYGCDVKHASSNCSRCLKNHPEIMARVKWIQENTAERVVDHMSHHSTTHEFIDKELLENLEHAKKFGKPILDADGVTISYERDHGVVNQTLKLMADINGFTNAAAKKRKREEEDENAELTASQLVKAILGKMNQKGEIGDGERSAIIELGDLATVEQGVGGRRVSPLDGLRSISEAKIVSSTGR